MSYRRISESLTFNQEVQTGVSTQWRHWVEKTNEGGVCACVWGGSDRDYMTDIYVQLVDIQADV